MAVAFGGTKSTTPTTGSSVTSSSWTISGSNLVIIIYIGVETASATISSVSWSLGSGTAVEIKTIRDTTHAPGVYGSIWAIPAPTAGSGTFTVNFSTSVAFQVTADYFTGADQTTPCPSADAWSSAAHTSPQTASVSNLTANDASAGLEAHTIAGNPTGVTPNQTYTNSTTNVNMQAGYATGTTQIQMSHDDATNADLAWLAVRIAAPSGGPTADQLVGIFSEQLAPGLIGRVDA